MNNIPSVDALRNSASDFARQAADVVSNPGDVAKSLGETLDSAKSSVSDSLSGYSSTASAGLSSATSAFLDSNSLIAKFAFLILVILLFMGTFFVGVKLISYFTQPASTVKLVDGLAPGGSQIQVSQNPQNSAQVILRSNNGASGMEFTWSVWINVTGVPDGNSYKHIFSKGSNSCNSAGVATPNNGPGVYLSGSDNGTSLSLNIFMDSVNAAACDGSPTLVVKNIPLQKWVHVAVRLQNNVLDVYVNGAISGRHQFQNVPKQNFDDVYAGGIVGTAQSGFNGNMSNLTYYNRAIGVFQINNIIMAGPSLVQSAATTGNASLGYYNYLSSLWYGTNRTK